MERRKVIIFGRNILNSLGQIRSFGERGFEPTLIWIGSNTHVLNKCKYLNECFCVNSHEEAFQLLVDKYSNEERKPLLSPDNDLSVLEFDNHYNELKDKFYLTNAGGNGVFKHIFEKYEMLQLAQKCGFNIPSTQILKVGAKPGWGINYPIFTKANWSLDPLWKNATSLSYNEEELMKAYKKMPFEEVLGQNFIEKKNEVFVEGISANHGRDIVCPILGQYYRLPKTSYGTYGWLEVLNEDRWHNLTNPLMKMLEEIGFEGIFDLQILMDNNDTPYFLEINFRTPVYHHTTNKMGVNLCSIWADSMVKGKIDREKIQARKNKVNFYLESLDYAWFVRTRKISLWRAIHDFCTSDCYMLWDKKDIRPVLEYIRRHI